VSTAAPTNKESEMRSRAFRLLLSGLALGATSPVLAATEYHWIGAPTAEFGTAGNWSPARTVPAVDDRLVFDGGAAYTVMNPTTATVGQFVVRNSTQLVIMANTGFGGRTISVAGGAGTDLEIQAGSSIRIMGDKGISFIVKNGATAVIGGSYTIDSNPAFEIFHQFNGEAAGSIEFTAGSVFELRAGMFVNPFSNGLAPDVPNMAHFRANSAYIHGCGQPPPITDVIFDPDSHYIHVDENPPTFVGRTYGDFDYNSPLAETVSGNGNFSLGDLTVVQGRLNVAVNGVGIVKGPISILQDAYLQLGPASGTLDLRLSGTGQQIIQNPVNDDGSVNAPYPGLTATAGLRLIVDNPAGVRYPAGNWFKFELPGSLQLVQGVLHVDDFVPLIVDGPITGGSTSSWIHGRVHKRIPPAQPTLTVPVGTATEFTPMTIDLHGLADTVLVSTIVQSPGDPPIAPLTDSSFAGAQLDTTRNVNLLYNLTFIEDAPRTSLDVTLGWQPANVDPGGNPQNFVLRMKAIGNVGDPNFGWRDHPTIVRGTTDLKAINVIRDDPGDYAFVFAAGEPSPAVAAPDGAPLAFGFDVASANPSGGATSFRLALTRAQHVRLSVHDVRGRLVAVPLDGERPAGAHRIAWDGAAAAGVYYVRVESAEGTAVRRVVRLD
jgi:hypothetical protein